MITEAKRRYGLPMRTLAVEMGLSPATLARWRRRLSRGQAAVGRRGPRKVKPLNIGELKERIQGLGHGRKRSRGSGSLHRTYADGISRREFDAMVRAVRQETSRSRVVNMYHVSVLEEALVIPINSPPYRAPYNGGIEHTQGEFKSYLDRWSGRSVTQFLSEKRS